MHNTDVQKDDNYIFVGLHKKLSYLFRLWRMDKNSWPEFLYNAQSTNFKQLLFLLLNTRYIILVIDKKNNALAASYTMIPMAFNEQAIELDDKGYDWVVSEGLRQAFHKTKNCFFALAVIIDPDYRRIGLNKTILTEMREAAKRHSVRKIYIPLRPTLKEQYPDTTMEDYIQMKDSQGRILDPWLRLHCEFGAQVYNVCSKSISIKKSIKYWNKNTGIKPSHKGDYSVKGALSKVHFNLEGNEGVYNEPNIWIGHTV